MPEATLHFVATARLLPKKIGIAGHLRETLLAIMKMFIITISLVCFISCVSNRSEYKEIITYHDLTREQKRGNGRVVKEKYIINKKSGYKHGKYEKYDLNFLTLEEGEYINGERRGKWKLWIERDTLFVEKDYDNNGIETPLIIKEYLKYPRVLVEKRDSLPEGIVRMKLNFDSECNLVGLEVVDGIDKEFNNVISSRYKRYVKLCKKYEVQIKECEEQTEFLTIRFNL